MTGKTRTLLAAAVLVFAIAAVYSQVVTFAFVNLDDPRYVTANDEVKRGLTAESVRWALTSSEIGFYCPMTCLSHMTDVQLYGLNPAGHHLTSLLLHAASAVLLLLAFRRMTGALFPSFIVAALFALHPLHVEPVAWISERKEVLSGFFWCVTLFAYAWYAEAPGFRRYLLVFAASTAAMLAKPMAVTIPFALLLLDAWPLGRWPATRASRLIVEKVPLFAPMALVSVLTVKAQAGLGALGSSESFPIGERAANALYAYAVYLAKMVVPVNLAALYPFRHGSMPLLLPLSGLIALLAGSAIAVLAFAKRRYVTVGWFWFVGTLVPTIGLIHVGSQSMADRYTYIPLIGLFAIVAFGGASALAAAPAVWRRAAAAVAVAVLAMLGLMSHAQALTWKNDESLYRQIIRVSPDAILAYFNLGNYYLAAKNEPQTAIELYEKALAIDPRYGDVQLRLGLALARVGKNDEALSHFQEAVRLKPTMAEARLALASALREQKRFGESADAFRSYLELQPNDWRGHVSLGMVSGELGAWDAACASLEKAAQLAPDQEQVWALLGFAQLQKGDRAGATLAFRRSIALEPRELERLRAIDPAMAQSLAGSATR